MAGAAMSGVLRGVLVLSLKTIITVEGVLAIQGSPKWLGLQIVRPSG